MIEQMPRTVRTHHLLNVSAAEYLELRLDPAYGEYKAALEKQAITIPDEGTEVDAEGNEVRWRSVEMHFAENPVPPFMRGLVKKLLGDVDMLALEERNYTHRCSFEHPTTLQHQFPKALAEVLSVTSIEWVEPRSDTQCEFHTQHEVVARMLGMGGAIEQAVENGIHSGYAKMPELLDAFLRHRKQMPTTADGTTKVSVPAPEEAALPNPLLRFVDATRARLRVLLVCARPRKPPSEPPSGRVGETMRRLSVTVEDQPGVARVISMTTSEGDEPCVGRSRSRTVAVSICESPNGRRITVDERAAPAQPARADSRCMRCLTKCPCSA